jgi:hypothetical protein
LASWLAVCTALGRPARTLTLAHANPTHAHPTRAPNQALAAGYVMEGVCGTPPDLPSGLEAMPDYLLTPGVREILGEAPAPRLPTPELPGANTARGAGGGGGGGGGGWRQPVIDDGDSTVALLPASELARAGYGAIEPTMALTAPAAEVAPKPSRPTAEPFAAPGAVPAAEPVAAAPAEPEVAAAPEPAVPQQPEPAAEAAVSPAAVAAQTPSPVAVPKAPSPVARAPSPAAKAPSPVARAPSPAAKAPSPVARAPSPAAKAPL